MVSTASIIVMALDMVLGVGVPLLLGYLLVDKCGLPLRTFLVGCATFILFALILEPVLHRLVLGGPLGETIRSSTLYYALYGGLAAGIFEETGRFAAMGTVLRKVHHDDGNALMYGAGHGGVEVLLVLGITMLNNLIISVLLNTGHLDLLTAKLDATQAGAFSSVTQQLQDLSPLTLLIAPLERALALILHISLSVLVWTAVTRRKTWLFPLAILLHASVDAAAVALSRQGMVPILVEGVLLILTALCAALALFTWKRCSLTFRCGEQGGCHAPFSTNP